MFSDTQDVNTVNIKVWYDLFQMYLLMDFRLFCNYNRTKKVFLIALKPHLVSFIAADIILVSWVTLAVELVKGVVVEVRFVKLGVLLGSWKLA